MPVFFEFPTNLTVDDKSLKTVTGLNTMNEKMHFKNLLF